MSGKGQGGGLGFDIPTAAPARINAATPLLGRIEALLDDEIDALRRQDLTGIADFSDRKARALLELTRSAAAIADGSEREAFIRRLAGLRHKLARAQQLIAIQLQAANQVARVLADVIRSNDTDGTYAPGSARGGETR